MASNDPHSGYWEDDGLWFALVFYLLVMVGLTPVLFILHKKFPRVLRPNRPGSRTSAFFHPQRAFLSVPEYEVLEVVGVRPMFHVLFLKYAAYLFLCLSLVFTFTFLSVLQRTDCSTLYYL